MTSGGSVEPMGQCDGEVRDGWHSRRCMNRAKRVRDGHKVCTVHDKPMARYFTGCNCAIHSPTRRQVVNP